MYLCGKYPWQMKYPLGIQSFEKIRREGFFYADKTDMISQIVNSGTYYFLSRPRRFGKSLLISTLEAYFLGKEDLFKGLAINQKEEAWNAYPVLHIDLNAERYESGESLNAIFERHFRLWEKSFGRDVEERTLTDRFTGIIRRAVEKTGRQVVILVDEYDKPLLQAIGNEALQDDFRATLKSVFGVMKTMDAFIRFGFMTGVTKLSKVSIFSDLNNLSDISADNRYSSLCGITAEEIHISLDAEVELLAEANHLSKEECYEKLRRDYDGYHFEHDTQGVYNPYSLLRTMESRQFKDYWFETGTPTYLVETLKRNNYPLNNLTREEISSDVLGDIDSINTTPIPLLYQSGYLTIKDYDARFGIYKMGFPNGEVERGFTRFLVPYYTSVEKGRSTAFVRDFIRDVESGHPELFMQHLDSIFAKGDYQIAGDAELYFQNAVYIVFTMLGFYTEVERHTSDGRMDMLIQTGDYIYILEFKLDENADVALRQIESKQYAKPFEHDARKLYKIGVSFSSQTRRIAEWKIE